MSIDLIQSLSPVAQSWLTDPASLTMHLRTFTHNQIEHCLHYNDWDETQSHWIRRMEWRFKHDVWVACVVSIPTASLTEELQNVGLRSIGEILFQDHTLTRSPFIFKKDANGCYTRESVFHFKQQPIYLSETFFPNFFKAIEL